MHEVNLHCPSCNSLLQDSHGNERLECSECGRTYPIVSGIPSFLENQASFYEGDCAFYGQRTVTVLKNIDPYNSSSHWKRIAHRIVHRLDINRKRERFLGRWLKGRQGRVLDLGCGVGHNFFPTVGYTVGVDIALAPLALARDRYPLVIQADVTRRLPLEDESFNFIVSCDLIGHIPVEKKDAMLTEIYRLLKPGGLTLHVAETDSDNVFSRFAHGYPDLFERYFVVKIGGHFGLEMPTMLVERFKRLGFVPRQEKKIWGTIWQSSAYSKLFGNEYAGKSFWINLLVWISRACSRNVYVQTLIDCALGPLSTALEVVTPLNHGTGLLLCYEKKL